MNDSKKKIIKIIPHSKPTLGAEEAERVAEVIRSARLAQGRLVQKFEHTFAEKLETSQAAATSSGTSALHLALLAMGVGAKDEVIIPSYVCTALLHAVRYIGATPVLADIDRQTGNLDPVDAKKRLSQRTKAIIVPHMFGLPADMKGIMAMGVPVIEDCAQAVGAMYKGKPVGTFGAAAIFSFYATKVMTTGEGGMVVSNSKKVIRRVKDLRDYDERPEYSIRFNYKMTDIQAALGLVQLGRLKTFVQRRRDIAKKYTHFLSRFDIELPPDSPEHIYFRYVVDITPNSSKLLKHLVQKGITCAKPVYKPLHRYLKQKGYPNSDSVWRRALSLPIYPSLSNRDVDCILSAFAAAYKETARE